MFLSWVLVVLVLVPCQVSAQDLDCPDGWVNGREEGCFGFFNFNINVTWLEAQLICEFHDAYLAEPKTVDQMAFLSGLASLEEAFTGIHSWWIGLTDLGHEGVWLWSHTNEVVTTSFWAKGSPNNRTHNSMDCGYIDHKHGVLGWRDIDCDENQGHGGSIAPVCQKGEVVTQTTPGVQTTTTDVSTTPTEPQTTTFAGCPFGWMEFEGSCFIVPKATLNVYEARAYCNIYDSELASIHSAEENSFVTSLANTIGSDSYFWLGGSDWKSEGNWIWTDGSAWDYEAWYSGEGFSGLDDCVGLKPSYNGWFDLVCSTVVHFVCRIN